MPYYIANAGYIGGATTWPTLLMSCHRQTANIIQQINERKGQKWEEKRQHVVLTRIILGLVSTAIASFNPKLDLVIQLNALLTKFPIVFILPTVLAIGLDGGWENATKRHKLGLGLLPFGVLGMVAIVVAKII